jgi:hypothetical protein
MGGDGERKAAERARARANANESQNLPQSGRRQDMVQERRIFGVGVEVDLLIYPIGGLRRTYVVTQVRERDDQWHKPASIVLHEFH